jgi:SAM-dependent methyltransferase
MSISLPQDRQYKGLSMRCAPGLHEAAFDLLRQHSSPDMRVLDVASGTGAWIQRLIDAGYSKIDASELDIESFSIGGVKLYEIDLEQDFAAEIGQSYDVVTAIEIIEHLENPRHFLRQIRKLLNPDGRILLTTPNVSGLAGRIHFLRHGDLRFFRAHDYEIQRHISPMTRTHLQIALNEVGFEIEASLTAGSFWGPVKRMATIPLFVMGEQMLRARGRGDVAVYLARKTDPDLASRGRDSRYFSRQS